MVAAFKANTHLTSALMGDVSQFCFCVNSLTLYISDMLDLGCARSVLQISEETSTRGSGMAHALTLARLLLCVFGHGERAKWEPFQIHISVVLICTSGAVLSSSSWSILDDVARTKPWEAVTRFFKSPFVQPFFSISQNVGISRHIRCCQRTCTRKPGQDLLERERFRMCLWGQEGLLAMTDKASQHKWGLRRHLTWIQTPPSARRILRYELLQHHCSTSNVV